MTLTDVEAGLQTGLSWLRVDVRFPEEDHLPVARVLENIQAVPDMAAGAYLSVQLDRLVATGQPWNYVGSAHGAAQIEKHVDQASQFAASGRIVRLSYSSPMYIIAEIAMASGMIGVVVERIFTMHDRFRQSKDRIVESKVAHAKGRYQITLLDSATKQLLDFEASQEEAGGGEETRSSKLADEISRFETAIDRALGTAEAIDAKEVR